MQTLVVKGFRQQQANWMPSVGFGTLSASQGRNQAALKASFR
jgi:hypothetical protein